MQLNTDSFSSLMAGFSDLGQTFAIAVSGGADSLALCLLCHEWATSQGKMVVALSVDHDLRVASKDECAFVKETMQRFGIEHHTLVWDGEKPHNGIQAAARKARYQLLRDWCVVNQVRDLFLAHHLNDQAETVLMRLARGSGVDGLSAMQATLKRQGINIHRPLLGIPKEALVSYLTDKGLSWVEDPSNKDESFDRVRIRNAMEILSSIGLTPQRLSQTAESMQRVRSYLDDVTQQWLLRYAKLFQEGYILLNVEGIQQGRNDEIILRALSRIGMVISGEIYPPRFEKLQRLLQALRQRESATLMSCRWIVEGETVLVCREIRQTDFPENVYRIDLKENSTCFSVRVLGEDGWQQILVEMPELRHSALPKPVIYALPSFWDKQGVSVVPHLGYKREDVIFEADIELFAQNGLFS